MIPSILPETNTRLEQRCVRIDSAEIHFEIMGAGEPLILLHGLSGSTRWWAHNIEALAAHFRLHIIDLLGFGRSRGQRFALQEAAHLLVAWMDRLEIPRASVIGHSMGGFIAAHVAVTEPARVQRLVLVDAAALVTDQRNYPQHMVGLVRGLLVLPFSFLPVLVTDAARAGPLTILKAVCELLITNIDDQLSALHTPTLVMWGEQDWVVPMEIGLAISHSLPNARFAVIPRAGHVPMWDQPAQFNRVALDFLLDRS
jgi:pimeloyl-ACP methyl ester carboxylesterase